MSTISGVSSSSDPWAAMKAQRQAKIFAKADANSDGSVDKTELTSMLNDISKKTGVSIGGDAADTLSKMDGNGDGKLSSDELSKGMQSLMPPPSTMDFAQTRSADAASGSNSERTGSQDDLFAKIDTNGDGTIDKTEAKVLSDKIKADTGQDSSDMFAKLDKDGDGKLTQAEFAAGKPTDSVQGASSKGTKGTKGPDGPAGPPPVAAATQAKPNPAPAQAPPTTRSTPTRTAPCRRWSDWSGLSKTQSARAKAAAQTATQTAAPVPAAQAPAKPRQAPTRPATRPATTSQNSPS